jgi:hypothetical protein
MLEIKKRVSAVSNKVGFFIKFKNLNKKERQTQPYVGHRTEWRQVMGRQFETKRDAIRK